MPYTFLIAKNKTTLTGKPITVETMKDFADRLVQFAPEFAKDKLSCPALFGPRKDNTRAKGSVVLPRNWLNIDIDGGKPINPETGKPDRGTPSVGIPPLVMKKVVAVLQEYEGFAHPTWSDKSNGRKLRVFLALDKELSKDDWENVSENFCRMLTEKVPELKEKPHLTASVDSASWRAAQFMYIPPKEKAAQQIHLEGKPIETAKYLNASNTRMQTTRNHRNSTRGGRQKNEALFPLDSVFGDGSEDPILKKIVERGLLIRDAPNGRYDIRCPIGGHDDGTESSTSYFAPGAVTPDGKRYRYGSIYCFHDTCRSQGYRTGDYFNALGINYEDYTKWIDRHFPIDTSEDFRASVGKFQVRDGTVYLTRVVKEEEITSPVFSEIEILGKAREEGDENWGRIVRFKNKSNRMREIFLADKDLTGKGEPVRETLSEAGLNLYTRSGIANALCDFIYYRPIEDDLPTYLVTPKTGWVNGAFVLPKGEIIGEPSEPIFYQSERGKDANFETNGNLEDWINTVAKTALYAPPLMLVLCAGFAAPLMRLLTETHECGGFHFYGSSGMGKTLVAKAAAGVYGKPSGERGRVIQWTATANSLEFWAEAHSDSLLCLDEINQADPKELAKCIYSLGNGSGKARGYANKNGEIGNRRIMTWRLLWVSTGEKTIAKHLKETGRGTDTGVDTRAVPIELDMGKTLETGQAMGIFEVLPEGKEFAEVCRLLADGADANYGIAGRRWIEFLIQNPQKVKDAEQTWSREFKKEVDRLTVTGLGAQQGRLARRFKLCAIAGELATEAGLTGWQPGLATKNAVRLMLRSFGDNLTETKEKKRLIRSFLKMAQNLTEFVRFGDTSRVKVSGYRNFDIHSEAYFEPSSDETPEDEEKAEDIRLPEEEVKTQERRLYLKDDTFEDYIGNYTPVQAAKILYDLNVLVGRYEDGGKKFRKKIDVRTGKNGVKMHLYTLRYDNLLALDDD